MITIYQQPASMTFAKSSKIGMSVGAHTDSPGGYLKYRWEYTAPGTTAWTAIQHPSAETASVTITPAMTGPYGTNQFRCVLTDYTNAGVKVTELISVTATATMFEGRTQVSGSKTRDASNIRSRLARHAEFELDPALYNTFLNLGLGTATLDDASDHIEYPNVQAAIVGIAGGMMLPLRSVIINRNNIDPSGNAQQTILTFAGTVKSPLSGQPVQMDIFGRRVSLPDSAIATQVRDAALAILTDMEAKDLYVKDVETVGSDGIAFRHRDHSSHVPQTWTQFDVTMSGVVSSPAAYGYGQWLKFAEVPVTDLEKKVSTLYYWERIS